MLLFEQSIEVNRSYFQWGISQWAALNCHFRWLEWECKLDETVQLNLTSINFWGSVQSNQLHYIKSFKKIYYRFAFSDSVLAMCLLFQLTSADLCIPFGWQLAHNKRLYSRLEGQLVSSALAICHVCNTIA